MSNWNSRRHGGHNPYGNAYRRDRRLAHKVLPAVCAACGRDDEPLEADHVPGVAEYMRRYGEPPPSGLRADEIPQWYRLLCPDCHAQRTRQQRAAGQRAAAARRAAEKEARRRRTPAEALGAGPLPDQLGVWPKVQPSTPGAGIPDRRGGSEADIVAGPNEATPEISGPTAEEA